MRLENRCQFLVPMLGKYKELQDEHTKDKKTKHCKPKWYCLRLPI